VIVPVTAASDGAAVTAALTSGTFRRKYACRCALAAAWTTLSATAGMPSFLSFPEPPAYLGRRMASAWLASGPAPTADARLPLGR
jgi:hypothetical protein